MQQIGYCPLDISQRNLNLDQQEKTSRVKGRKEHKQITVKDDLPFGQNKPFTEMANEQSDSQ